MENKEKFDEFECLIESFNELGKSLGVVSEKITESINALHDALSVYSLDIGTTNIETKYYCTNCKNILVQEDCFCNMCGNMMYDIINNK